VLSITRNKTPVKYTYTLHGHQLEHADKAKYLGVTIQSDLKWDSHINNITTKVNNTLGENLIGGMSMFVFGIATMCDLI
jgi:hypothetical protein